MRMFGLTNKGQYNIVGLLALTVVFATPVASAEINWQVIVPINGPVQRLDSPTDYISLAKEKVCISKVKNAGAIFLESNFDVHNNPLTPVKTGSWAESLNNIQRGFCGSAVVPEYAIKRLSDEQQRLYRAIRLKQGPVFISTLDENKVAKECVVSDDPRCDIFILKTQPVVAENENPDGPSPVYVSGTICKT